MTGLPEPVAVRPSGAVVFEGGVHALGDMVIIPGRSLGLEQLGEARQHAAAILAACEVVERACRPVAVQVCAGAGRRV